MAAASGPATAAETGSVAGAAGAAAGSAAGAVAGTAADAAAIAVADAAPAAVGAAPGAADASRGSGTFSCAFCNKRGIKSSFALQSHLRGQHGQAPGFLAALAALLPAGEAFRVRTLGARLHVVWEDDWLAVVEKPQGVPTQGRGMSLQRADWLLAQLRGSALHDALRGARPAHRLDAGTGGLLLLAKSAGAVRTLTSFFEAKAIQKRYRALVHGRLERGTEGTCADPLDGGKPALTRYRVAEDPVLLSDGWVSTVDLWPLTGRTHQLRKHLSLGLGCPIVGDRRYGGWRPAGSGLLLGGSAEGDEASEDDDSEAGDAAAGNDHGSNVEGETAAAPRIFCLWALEIKFPHPAHESCGNAAIAGAAGAVSGVAADVVVSPAASSEPASAADGSSAEVVVDFDVALKRSELESLRRRFATPPQRKKQKKKDSCCFVNVISGSPADPGDAGGPLRAGDLLIRVAGVDVAANATTDPFEAAVGAAAEADAEGVSASSQDLVLTFRRFPRFVRAELPEPELFTRLRALATAASTTPEAAA